MKILLYVIVEIYRYIVRCKCKITIVSIAASQVL